MNSTFGPKVRLIFCLMAVAISSMTTLRGQACCTLQGFSGNSSFGSISDFDGLDFANPTKRTQIQLQFSGSDDWDDWVRNNMISNGPLLGYSATINHFLRKNILLGAAISGNVSSISGVLVSGSESDIILHNLQLRANWLSPSRRHVVWLRFTQPVYESYSNENFPLRTSTTQALELGYGYVKTYHNQKGKPRIVSVRGSVRKDRESKNLYQFDYYSTGQISWRYRIYSDLVPIFSLFAKHGSLRVVDPNGIYTIKFDARLFAYGSVGGGVEYRTSKLKGLILRIYGFYPILRWKNNPLPGGFEEKPVLGMTLTKSFSLKNKHLKENP